MIPADVHERVSDSYRLFLSLLYCEKPVVTGAFTVEGFDVLRDLQLVEGHVALESDLLRNHVGGADEAVFLEQWCRDIEMLVVAVVEGEAHRSGRVLRQRAHRPHVQREG